ncbi:MAG: Alpha-ketoglutarate-dependent taurine dioxygenase [Alphaproteobacteria bacterium MarineAlpha4_Bin2]|nr:MAG: Alpha-ketoglutarate-dependent taurine dioxygenase [Alphaproteobacteria bacterium MarineAlpha4_Bin2]
MEVVRLGDALGAEIHGLDISQRLCDEDIDAIRRAWHEHHVILFRGVEWSPEGQLEFAGRFGELDDHAATPNDSLKGFPKLLEVSTIPKNGKPSPTRTAGRDWHSDYAYTSHPASASLLYCIEKPEVGGDTMFCNMARAYSELSEKMKGIASELHSVYDFNMVSGAKDRTNNNLTKLNEINPPVAHPTVRVHNESGVKALYVSERTSHFDGMTRSESAPLIRYFCEHATRPENVYRHQWRVGDLVCWDNRTTMHLALGDFDLSARRRMLRATVRGPKSGYVLNGAA